MPIGTNLSDKSLSKSGSKGGGTGNGCVDPEGQPDAISGSPGAPRALIGLPRSRSFQTVPRRVLSKMGTFVTEKMARQNSSIAFACRCFSDLRSLAESLHRSENLEEFSWVFAVGEQA